MIFSVLKQLWYLNEWRWGPEIDSRKSLGILSSTWPGHFREPPNHIAILRSYWEHVSLGKTGPNFKLPQLLPTCSSTKRVLHLSHFYFVTALIEYCISVISNLLRALIECRTSVISNLFRALIDYSTSVNSNLLRYCTSVLSNLLQL
jgi:hypothetical protein